MKKLITLAACAATLILLASAQVQAEKPALFRWTDENGKVHFGDTPPEHLADKAEELKRPMAPMVGQDANVRAIEERTQRLMDSEQERKSEETHKRLMALEDKTERLKPRCQEARRNIEALSGPVVYRDKDGSRYDVSEEQREADLKKWTEWEKDNCQGL